jgi:hypothetical protein
MRFPSNSLLCVTLTTLAATLSGASVQGADFVKPNVKPGLWEVTLDPQVSGEMAIPEDKLANLTPEQRAQMEAAMKAYVANSSKPKTYKECMTPEKIAQGFDIAHRDDPSCTRKVISSSANELTVHDECNNPPQQSVSDSHFEMKSGTQITGKYNYVMTSNGKTMKLIYTIKGKWLGASCGSVKDSELEKK